MIVYKENGKETITDGKKDWGAIVFGDGFRRAWDISGDCMERMVMFLCHKDFIRGMDGNSRDTVTSYYKGRILWI